MLEFTHDHITLSIDPNESYFDGDSLVIFAFIDSEQGFHRLLAVGDQPTDSSSACVHYDLSDDDDRPVDVELPAPLYAKLEQYAYDRWAQLAGAK